MAHKGTQPKQKARDEDDAGKIPTQRYLGDEFERELLYLIRRAQPAATQQQHNMVKRKEQKQTFNQYAAISSNTLSFKVDGGCRVTFSSHHLSWSVRDFEPSVCYLPTNRTLSSTRSKTAQETPYNG